MGYVALILCVVFYLTYATPHLAQNRKLDGRDNRADIRREVGARESDVEERGGREKVLENSHCNVWYLLLGVSECG